MCCSEDVIIKNLKEGSIIFINHNMGSSFYQVSSLNPHQVFEYTDHYWRILEGAGEERITIYEYVKSRLSNDKELRRTMVDIYKVIDKINKRNNMAYLVREKPLYDYKRVMDKIPEGLLQYEHVKETLSDIYLDYMIDIYAGNKTVKNNVSPDEESWSTRVMRGMKKEELVEMLKFRKQELKTPEYYAAMEFLKRGSRNTVMISSIAYVKIYGYYFENNSLKYKISKIIFSRMTVFVNMVRYALSYDEALDSLLIDKNIEVSDEDVEDLQMRFKAHYYPFPERESQYDLIGKGLDDILEDL